MWNISGSYIAFLGATVLCCILLHCIAIVGYCAVLWCPGLYWADVLRDTFSVIYCAVLYHPVLDSAVLFSGSCKGSTCLQLLVDNRTDSFWTDMFLTVICFCLCQSQLDKFTQTSLMCQGFLKCTWFSSTASAGSSTFLGCLFYIKNMSELKTYSYPWKKYYFAVFSFGRNIILQQEKKWDHCRNSRGWRQETLFFPYIYIYIFFFPIGWCHWMVNAHFQIFRFSVFFL